VLGTIARLDTYNHDVFAYADDGWVSAGPVVGLKPGGPPFFVFGKLVDLFGVMRADALQSDHVQDGHTPVAEGGAQLFGQEEVAGGEAVLAGVVACVAYLGKVRHFKLVLEEPQLDDQQA